MSCVGHPQLYMGVLRSLFFIGVVVESVRDGVEGFALEDGDWFWRKRTTTTTPHTKEERLAAWLAGRDVCSRWGARKATSIHNKSKAVCECPSEHVISVRCGIIRPCAPTYLGIFESSQQRQFHPIETCKEEGGTCSFWAAHCRCVASQMCQALMNTRVATSMVGVAAVDFCTRLLDAVKNGSRWKRFKNIMQDELRGFNAKVNPFLFLKHRGYNPHYADGKIAKKLTKKTKDLLAEREADKYCQAAVAGIENASDAAVELVNEKPLGADDVPGPARLNLMNTLQGQSNTTWQHSLTHVCKKECSDIVREVKKEAEDIFAGQLAAKHSL